MTCKAIGASVSYFIVQSVNRTNTYVFFKRSLKSMQLSYIGTQTPHPHIPPCTFTQFEIGFAHESVINEKKITIPMTRAL